MSRYDVVKRHQYADYLNVGTAGKEDFVLMGAGFTTLDENPSAQSESTKYVNEVSASSEVVGYETSFPFEAEQIADEKAIDALYKVGRNHLVGTDAMFDYIRVELWNKATGSGASATSFEARKFVVSAEISSISGENKQTIAGNLNAVGDPVLGTFDTSAKKFTAASAT